MRIYHIILPSSGINVISSMGSTSSGINSLLLGPGKNKYKVDHNNKYKDLRLTVWWQQKVDINTFHNGCFLILHATCNYMFL